MEIYADSHIGMVRKENQDAFRILRVSERVTLAVVCDGMGGAAGGRTAATLAIEEFCKKFEECYRELIGNAEPTPFDVHRVYGHAVYHANLAVFHRAVTVPALAGMGTTLTAACFFGSMLFTANVGDSRVYLIRRGDARRITHDDSLVQQYVDEGMMTEPEAEESEEKNLLTRVLGTSPYVEFSFESVGIEPADRVLLCSDGLHGYYTPEQLAASAHSLLPLRAAVEGMIEGACLAGGRDNITCVLAQV